MTSRRTGSDALFEGRQLDELLLSWRQSGPRRLPREGESVG